MARSRSSYLNELSTTDLKQLLAARQRIDVLEKDRSRLLKELAAIESELKRLVASVKKPSRAGAGKKTAKKAVRKKTVARKKTAKKKTVKKKTAAKKTVSRKKTVSGKKTVVKKTVKKAVKKTTRTKATRKKTVKKAVAGKSPSRKKTAKAAGQPRLEDVVVGIIKSKGKPVAYKDIMTRIKSGKLFVSRSSNFDNVLRRTLSTSKKVKRVGRGIYDIA